MIGIHIPMTQTCDMWKYNIFQMFAGNPQKLHVNNNLNMIPDDSTIVIHASYVAHAAPKPEYVQKDRKYLSELSKWAEQRGVYGIVLHLGSTKNRDKKDLIKQLKSFFKWYKGSTKIFIENMASASELNNDMEILDIIKSFGLCIDVAHSWSSGWTEKQIISRIKKYKPGVIHLNAPSGMCGSGRDTHGWWYEGQYNHLLRAIVDSTNVPLILEGGSYCGDIGTDLKYVRRITKCG